MAAIALLLTGTTSVTAQAPVELLFIYGSEKESWINEVTDTFHKTNPTTKDGRPITVKAVPLGSGETVQEVLDGTRKAHLISPASGAYLELGNDDAKTLGQPPLVNNKTRHNLVRSPVVIAMWKPMAEALGWPDKPVGWSDLRKLAVASDGWGSKGHKEWGTFKFGHTHPKYSNSGLIAVFSQVYAASGKGEGMKPRDVQARATAEFFKELQKAIVHYGESTGFFGDQMFANGVDYLSAAVLYESVVVESYKDKWKGKLAYPVVAIYPKEGTFWSDHPVAVVEREWVGPAEREAAKLYIDYLLQEPQQRKALKSGFRPGLEKVRVDSPIDEVHGVDPKIPRILETPSVEVMRACLKSWQRNKKNVRLVLVLDKSGSMNEDDRLLKARKGCKDIIDGLSDRDVMGILTFSDDLKWISPGKNLNESEKAILTKKLYEIDADGETALYDAIAEAHRHLQKTKKPGEITAIIVLTDGDDNKSKLKLEALLDKVKYNPKRDIETRIFTIAYGSLIKDLTALEKIAKATKATASVGEPKTIKGDRQDLQVLLKGALPARAQRSILPQSKEPVHGESSDDAPGSHLGVGPGACGGGPADPDFDSGFRCRHGPGRVAVHLRVGEEVVDQRSHGHVPQNQPDHEGRPAHQGEGGAPWFGRDGQRGARRHHQGAPDQPGFRRLPRTRQRRCQDNEATASREQQNQADNLVRSPVVIAMWKPMAEALGWPDKPVGWKDLRNLAVASDGWGLVGHKEWGAFKFGHTHPEYSNSGLIAVLAQVYAATGKEDEMTVKDVEDIKTARFLSELQKAIVHYGSSTGFFGDKMFSNGVDYLGAAVLYENMVVESYSTRYKGILAYPVVAVYPREGTFWSDHPVCVVERKWVGPAEREAAEKYIEYLLQEPQQRKALKHGFRPGLEKVKVDSPIDKKHGVDPKIPRILETPSVEVMRACLKSWQKNKKSARVLLVFDKSGSMNRQEKLKNAKLGALEIVAQLRDEDSLALLTFNNEVKLPDRGTRLKGGRERLTKEIQEIDASGKTSLYDAIAIAHRHVQTWFDPDVICAVVVLTDGEDNTSKLKLKLNTR